jgi:NitT/TauT family transport system ATP-binding protein
MAKWPSAGCIRAGAAEFGEDAMTTKIHVSRVGMTFGSAQQPNGVFTALADVDLEIQSSEILVLVGPSGCGKSTLLDLIAGLTTPTSGEILLDGHKITGPGPDRSIIFQQYALFPWRTAQSNVEFALEGTAMPRAERRRLARQFLALVGLSGAEDRYPHQLSGGMRQRVAIARSLSRNPEVLLMDEPFAAVDAQTREMLQDEILRIWKTTRKTILFITHSIDEAVYLGHRVAVMAAKPGRVIDIIDSPFAGHAGGEDDLRSKPEFGRVRHHIWQRLRPQLAA